MTITTERLRQAEGNRERIDMEVKEVRRRNLIYLLFTAKERDGINRKDFAAKCDTDPAVISQVTSTTQKTQRNIGDERYEMIKLTGNYKILGYVTDFIVSLNR